MRCLVLALVLLAACKVKIPRRSPRPGRTPSSATTPGRNYYKTGPGYAVDHAMNCKGAHNHPLWLRKKLPRDVRIELDAWSNSPAGDIKIELFGDGHSYDPDAGAYMATGYEVIFGGWHNSKSIIARLDEHGKDMAERIEPKVVPGKHYHWKIERQRQEGHMVDRRHADALPRLRRSASARRPRARVFRLQQLGSRYVVRQPHDLAALITRTGVFRGPCYRNVMRSVWCIVVAVGLMAAGGHVRAAGHARTSELHATAAPATVAVRRTSVATPHLAAFAPPAPNDLAAVPRIAIAVESAGPRPPSQRDRTASRSSRGPPRA